MATIDKKNLRQHIQEILKGADLSSLSSKKVRRKLEEIFDQDLSDRKKEIDDLLMKLIAERQEQESKKDEQESKKVEQDSSKKTDSESEHSDDEQDKKTVENGKAETNSKTASSESESDVDLIEPPPKKQKSKKSAAKQNDEELAKQLQAEEESGVRRSSRAATTKNTKATIKRSIKYSQYGKKSDDPNAKAKKPRQYILSPALAEIMETDKMGRSEVVKRMWEIVKERNLADPKNKSFMICDEEMQKIFGRKRVRTFGMMKYLTDHMFTQEQYDYSFT